MRTIIRMLHEAAAKYRDRAFVSSKTDKGWTPYSYTEVDNLSDIFASALLSRGFKAGDSAGILAEGRPEWVIGEFGIIKAGLISVPLSIKLTPEEIAFRINHSEAKVFLVSRNVLPKIIEARPSFTGDPLLVLFDAIKDTSVLSGENFVFWSDFMREGENEQKKNPQEIRNIENGIKENDTINICYTSGTTGNPKGIMLTHLNYWANTHDSLKVIDIPDSSFSTLIMLPLDHSFAHTAGLYISLLRGMTLNFVDARGGSINLIRNIPVNLVETNPSLLMTVPAISGNFMKKIISGVAAKGSFINGIFTRGIKGGIAYNGDGFKRPPLSTRLRAFFPYKLASLLVFPKVKKIFGTDLTFCIGGGALLELKQQQFFAALGIPIFQGYGLTEAAPVICTNADRRHKFGTSGTVLPGITIRIMKSDDEEALTGERGEIVIKGDNVMKGYFKNEKATREALRDGWLWTGDLGYMDDDNFLVVTGRAKALLISPDGEKYSPEDIEEAVLNNCDLVNQIMVYNDHKNFTTALITLNEENVKNFIKEKRLSTPEDTLKALHESIYSFKNVIEDTIPSQWIPATMEIIPKAFSEEDKLINSTMKLVRYKVTEFYQTRIDEMYRDNDFFNGRNTSYVKNLLEES